jgi:Cys-rich protein (TIGR01571 family)
MPHAPRVQQPRGEHAVAHTQNVLLWISQSTPLHTLRLTMSWSSGFFSVYDDFNVAVLGFLNPYVMVINNATLVTPDAAIFGCDGLVAPVFNVCKPAGCIGKPDDVFCANMCAFGILPCVAILWRGSSRTKFGIQVRTLSQQVQIHSRR